MSTSFYCPSSFFFGRSNSAHHQTQKSECSHLKLLPTLHTKRPDKSPQKTQANPRSEVIIFIKKSSGRSLFSKKYLAKISGAKDSDVLPQQITSRYNVTITAMPESPEHLAGIIV